MAKVEVVNTDTSVTLSDGRVVTLRRPRPIDQLRATEIIGDVPDRTLAMLMVCLYIQTIDGTTANFATRAEMDALIERLGDGYYEIADAIRTMPVKGGNKDLAKKSPPASIEPGSSS